MEQKRELRVITTPGYKKPEGKYPFAYHDKSNTFIIGSVFHSHSQLRNLLKKRGVKGRVPVLLGFVARAEKPGFVMVGGVTAANRKSLADVCKALTAQGFGKMPLFATSTNRTGRGPMRGTVSQVARRKFK
jgi:hypothetical protein